MAIKKESLNNFLPDGFETLNQEGYKENFSADKISTGYEKDVPDIVSGPNLNNLIDVIGKNTNILNSYVEYLNSLSVNKTPIVDSNNQLNSTQIGLKVYSATETYLLNDLVTTIQDEKVLFYKSLVASNIGNPLTNTDYWEEVKLGGGSGLEICDIGMALFVDETKGLRRYLNGQVVDINTNTQAFLNRLKKITTLHPSLLCTEEEWQTAKTMSAFGQVGKFVFNYSGDEIVSVRLPRVVNVQGLFDLQNLGMTVSAGLPTHTHTRGTMEISGAFQVGGDAGTRPQSGSSWANGAFNITGTSGNANTFENTGGRQTVVNSYDFYASRSWTGSTSAPDNSVYGASNTVQPEAIQYPYFIQIATGSETENNIINDIELNNPYSLFDSKYSDHELNNLSWLKSEGQWNAKATYPTAYDKLLKVYNGTETVEGLSVKLSTETYTDYDFVLNTTDETFRLPLKTKLASGKAIVGNGMTLGLTNGAQLGGLQEENDNTIRVRINAYGKPIGTSWQEGNMYDRTLGVTTDPTKSGIETSDSGLYLYFYVGETVQNANLIDAGRIGEQLATKEDINTWVYYQNGTSGYRYNRRNGYCEQWGQALLPPSGTTVNLLKTYKNKDYNLVGIFGGTTVRESMGIAEINTKNSFKIYHEANLNSGFCLRWKTSGYLAQGEY